MKIINEGKVHGLLDTLQKQFGPAGFEFYPFKIDWYNSCIAPIFHQPYNGDIIAVLIISQPDMFEKTFLPFLKKHYNSTHSLDPIDDCMVSCLSRIKEMFPDLDVELIYDYERHSNRRPKILLQTAAHVSGAAYFYQKKHIVKNVAENQNMILLSEDVVELILSPKAGLDLTGITSQFAIQISSSATEKCIYIAGLNGVCIHPLYGGWFAFRGVAIFRNIQCPDFPYTGPVDVVPSQKDKLLLLTLFSNYNDGDWAFRDIIPVKQKYSDLQIKYFSTLPKDRPRLIESWFQGK